MLPTVSKPETAFGYPISLSGHGFSDSLLPPPVIYDSWSRSQITRHCASENPTHSAHGDLVRMVLISMPHLKAIVKDSGSFELKNLLSYPATSIRANLDIQARGRVPDYGLRQR